MASIARRLSLLVFAAVMSLSGTAGADVGGGNIGQDGDGKTYVCAWVYLPPYIQKAVCVRVPIGAEPTPGNITEAEVEIFDEAPAGSRKITTDAVVSTLGRIAQDILID